MLEVVQTNFILSLISEAQFSDGSCETLIVSGCINSLFLEFDPLANVDDNSCETVRVEGCTSQIADNYNPLANDDIGTCTFNDVMTELSSVNDSLIVLNDMVINCSATLEPIYIDLVNGWNTIGFTLRNPQDVVETLAPIVDKIKIIKNNDGQFYWPEMGPFNQIGDFIPGQGYLLKMNSSLDSYYFPIP